MLLDMDYKLLYTCENGKCRLETLFWLNNTIQINS